MRFCPLIRSCFFTVCCVAALTTGPLAGSAQPQDTSDSTANARPAQPPGDEAPEAVENILFGSCIKQQQPVPIFDAMLAERADLLVFLGDNIYADTRDMAVMRAKYSRLSSIPGFVPLTDRCPTLAIWDDHDYGVNDGGADYSKRSESQQVFCDFWNVPADDPRRDRPGVYHARVFGPRDQRVQVILLDTRYFRSPLKKGPRRVGGPYQPDDDPAKTMLGEAQWSWLEEQLRVPADVRIIATSIQCVAEAAGQETWSNLPRERERLFRLIAAAGAGGVVLISGDRHWSELSVARTGTPYPLYDLTSSSLNQVHERGTPTENRHRALEQTYHQPNFGLLQIDWQQPDPPITLQIRDLKNEVQIEKTLRLSELKPASSAVTE